MMSAQEDELMLDAETIEGGASNNNNNSSTGAASTTGALFPLARIKKIMKADKDVNLVSADAVHLVSAATEMFLDAFVKKASDISQNEKRRTILYKDFASAVKQDVRYSFLQELIPETVSVQVALEAQKHHGMVQSFTPAHSPVMDTDDHFESFKSSSSNINGGQASSMKSSKSASSSSAAADFFTKRTPANNNGGNNLNFLLNSSSAVIGQEEEIVDISDDIH